MTIEERKRDLIEQARMIAFSASSPDTYLRTTDELAQKDADEFKEYFETELDALLHQVAKEQRELCVLEYCVEYEKRPYGILSRNEAHNSIINAPSPLKEE